MTTTQASRDATTNTAPDGLALLEADHRAVEKLFAAFKKTADDDLEAKSTLAQRACEELSIHTVLEEEMLYPAAQKALPDSDKLDVEEAYIEHYLVKTLIQKFETLRAGDTGFDDSSR
jgi:hemerythrin superfamily protein